MSRDSLFGVLSEKTLMPMSLVVILGGIVFWASSIAARADMANEKVDQLEVREAALLQMREDVARISTRVDMIYDRLRAMDGERAVVK